MQGGLFAVYGYEARVQRARLSVVDPKSAFGRPNRLVSPIYDLQLPFFNRALKPATAPWDICRRLPLLFLLLALSTLLALLFIGGIHVNPGPSSPPPPVAIVGWNCNGVRNSTAELAEFASKRQAKIICLQETKLTGLARDPSFPGYTIVRQDRPSGGGGGGLMTLVHHSLTFVKNPSPINDGVTETQSISVKIADLDINVINVYIPPQSSCPPNYQASIAPLLNSDTIVLGDINAHDDLWSPGSNDPRGDCIADELDNFNFVSLNDPSIATRPSSSSSPDVVFCSANLSLGLSWAVASTLNSDHYPLLISIDDDTPPPRISKSYISYRKANWKDFSRDVESMLAAVPLPSSCSKGEQVWRRIIQKAAARHIPSGYVKDYTPSLDPESRRLIDERDEVRRQDPNDASLPDLNQRVSASISASARARWMEAVAEADRRTNPQRFWNLLKRLSGKRAKQNPNQPIAFGQKTQTSRSGIANAFCKQYMNSSAYKASKESRETFRAVKRNNLDHNYSPFTEEMTREAIKMAKNSTAVGPNNVNILHLKHLGRNGIRFLTRLFNLSVRHADIPAIWKAATIIPVPKPGKPQDQGLSYRPISLLCPEVKVLERLLFPSFSASFDASPNQHGFRPGRSTITALLPLSTRVAEGFNQPKPASRTGLLSIDLSKAFDIVDRAKLMEKVNRTNLHGNLKRWLLCYLRDRRVRVLYQGSFSRWRKSRLGVPQGSVISPLLFIFFVGDLSLDRASINESFADDFHSAESSPEVAPIELALNETAADLVSWTNDNNMLVSAPKSSVTLFTTWTKQVDAQLDVAIDGIPVPTVKNPRLLGVLLDPLFTFNAHASAIAKKCASRLNLLRALADTKFGHDKEVLLSTFKTYIRSVIDYGAPIVYPNYSATSINKLQRIQSRALRLALGCHTASSIDHLHSEAAELPVRDHLHLLSAQFLARALQPSHPSHPHVTRQNGRRSIKNTLRSKCIETVRPYLDANEKIAPGTYRQAIKDIHTDAVNIAIDNSGPNRVLGTKPPQVSKQERRLPRVTRSVLSQLRSGFCSKLRDFQFRLGRSTTSSCPECDLGEHTVAHLFDCPRHPTPLNPIDLWAHPCDVAAFLSRLPSFSEIPPPPPPPPPRVRRRGRPPRAPPDQQDGTRNLSVSSLFSSSSLPDFRFSSSSPPSSPLSSPSSFSLFSSPEP